MVNRHITRLLDSLLNDKGQHGLLLYEEIALSRDPIIAALKELGVAIDAWLSDPTCNRIGVDVVAALVQLIPQQFEVDCVLLSALAFPAMDELHNRQWSVYDYLEQFKQALQDSSSNSLWRAALNLRASVDDYFRWVDTLFNA